MLLAKRSIWILFSVLILATQVLSVEKKILRKKKLIVDVCTAWEFRQKHYPGAINIPSDEIEGKLKEFGNKKRPVVVYCASGVRAEEAKETLQELGFTNVTNGGSLEEMLKNKKSQ